MNPLRFDVHPSVAFQLGADLISDDAQALLELVKNCYDADAKNARIDIDTRAHAMDVQPASAYPQAAGVITVTDDGSGMDLATVENAWLVMSNSPKRKLKAGGKSPKGRVPLGDKGLGRLGTQRLADNVELFTKDASAHKELHVAFRWSDFESADMLKNVQVQRLDDLPSSRKQGTTIVLSGLREPERWRGEDARTELEQRLSELVSPFEEIKDFTLTVRIDGTPLEPAEVSRRIRREADSTFRLEFDGTTFDMDCRVKLRYLEPAGDERRHAFESQVLHDQGRRLFRFLDELDAAKRPLTVASGSGPWFMRLKKSVSMDSLPGLAIDGAKLKANPGPFRGEIDSFDYDQLPTQSAFGTSKDFARHIKQLAGVRVYRDGFGVKVDRDFLQLAKAWTGGKSWYGLKPANTIGFIQISAAKNQQLVESTDREGFKTTPHFKNFQRLLEEFVKFSSDSLEFLRRGTLQFCDSFLQFQAGVAEAKSPEDVASSLKQVFAVAGQAKATASQARHTAEQVNRAVTKAVADAGRAKFANDRDAQAFRAAVAVVESQQSRLVEIVDRMEGLATEVASGQAKLDVLYRQIEALRDQLRRSMEAIGLATTVEALTHEIAQIASGLGERVLEVKRHIGKPTERDRVAAFLRHVEAAITGLRKQLAHIEPSLRYARERREVIVLSEFLQEFASFHRDRLANAHINVDVDGKLRSPFAVRVNRGKLTQVFDNLLYNSEYWLREDMRLGKLSQGQVTIELDSPRVSFRDNGPGVDPAVENAIFDAFVSTKKNGRGLGLFIIRELLAGDDGAIRLLPEKNKHGRRYIFEIDFAGMENGRD
ncbi:MAG: sensor histidine kinase [Phycisphaeraceae bacterium]|nr:sensor histidine kinase [Phycisphaeraceae bacterium]